MANETGVIRETMLPCWLPSTPSTGCAHQVIAVVRMPTATAAASAEQPSLTVNQRRRVTDWFQASR
jgi:hypothetical protein